MPELSPAVANAQRGAPLATRRRAATTSPGSGVRRVEGGGVALSESERGQIVDTFVELLEGLYAHLPLKRAMYAIDPVQRLRLLRQRVASIDDTELHAEVAATLTSLRDAHTRHIGPAALEGQVATLPFLVEAYGQPGGRRYIVSKVAQGTKRISDTRFVAGVEILHWNAVPIDRAVDLHAERETGGRRDARRARAVESLTFRTLQYLPAPDEDWVVIGYRGLDGVKGELRVDWHVVTPGRARTAVGKDTPARRAMATDPAAELARRVKKLLFAPRLWEAERGLPSARAKTARAPQAGQWIDTDFHDAVGAKELATRHGRFAYLRLWSFDVADDVAFVAEVVRLLAPLPQDGVIIDLRSNPGGLVWAAERLLQLFTPHPVATTRFSMVATALTRAMVRAPQNELELEPWQRSVNAALATGDVYSHAVALTPAERANDIGQVYGGPVVAVVDANTYSSGDLFAAGFADNSIGTLVGVDAATGGGGANVWEAVDVNRAVAGTTFEREGVPGGVGYTMAVRRATRSGGAEGGAIEDVGVEVHEQYAMTKRDLTGDNRGLFDFCGRLLKDQAVTGMNVEPQSDPSFRVATRGLDRVDLVVDGRPQASIDVTDQTPTTVAPSGTGTIELLGYVSGELKQRRQLQR